MFFVLCGSFDFFQRYFGVFRILVDAWPTVTGNTQILGTNHFTSERRGLGDWVIWRKHDFFLLYCIILKYVLESYIFSPSSTLHDFCGLGWQSRLSFINQSKEYVNKLWTFNLEFLIDLDNTKANIGEILSRGTREHASTENGKS